MLPAISLPLKFVEPIRIAINSLPNILNTSSKLFSFILRATGFSVSLILFIHSNTETFRIRITKPVFRYSHMAARHPFMCIMYCYTYFYCICRNNTEHDYAKTYSHRQQPCMLWLISAPYVQTTDPDYRLCHPP